MIQFVGQNSGSGTGATYDISLTALTGGIDTEARENDIVVVFTGWCSTSVDDPGVDTSGYTELANQFQDDTRDANLSTNWKRMGSTPDTLVTVRGANNAANGGATLVMVWRGVDTTTAIDVTRTLSAASNTSRPDGPSITPVTVGAVIITGGLGTADTTPSTSFIPPRNYDNACVVAGTGSTRSSVVMACSRYWISGATNPEAWLGGESTTSDSAVSISLALRPAVDTGYGTFTAPGRWLCPSGVTSVVVEVWGSGGAGGQSETSSNGGGGGGGGAYSKKTVTVTPSTTYSYAAGNRGIGSYNSNAGGLGGAGGNGEDSWFIDTTTVMAKGGLGGSASDTGGTGGASASGVGDVKYSGGNGGNGTGSTTNNAGGGGGGSAGSSGAGGNGSGTTAGSAGSGGGATGGTGAFTGSGTNGGNPGAGGGGINYYYFSSSPGYKGGYGQVKISVVTSIKNVNGLIKDNVKTINGLAITNVKTFNNLA